MVISTNQFINMEIITNNRDLKIQFKILNTTIMRLKN